MCDLRHIPSNLALRRHCSTRRRRRFDSLHPLVYKWVRFPNFLRSIRTAQCVAGQRRNIPESRRPSVIDLEISS